MTENVRPKPIVFVKFNIKKTGRPKAVTLQALLDSGRTGSLVSKKYAMKLKVKKNSKAEMVWTTPSGKMTMTEKCRAQFTLPELHDNRLIEWDLHIHNNLGSYDMIIG